MGRKMKQKLYKRFSGYPSGLKQTPLEEMLKTKPKQVLQHAIKGMLPKGPLGRDIFKKLKVYAGSEHRHQAQRAQDDGSYRSEQGRTSQTSPEHRIVGAHGRAPLPGRME